MGDDALSSEVQVLWPGLVRAARICANAPTSFTECFGGWVLFSRRAVRYSRLPVDLLQLGWMIERLPNLRLKMAYCAIYTQCKHLHGSDTFA